MVNLFAAAQWPTFDHQNRNRLRAAERDQFLFVVGIFPDVFLDDLILAVKIGHAIQHALRKTALIVEIKLQRHKLAFIDLLTRCQQLFRISLARGCNGRRVAHDTLLIDDYGGAVDNSLVF